MIIIETPAPPTRERLVLVPVGETHAHCRDATPEDLARAGYVLLVGYLPRREVETAVSDAMDQRQLGEALQRAATAERERGEARADRDAQLVRALDAERDLGATMREVATLRAELARLTAVEGEPTDEEILDAWQHAGAGVTEAWLYRAGVARERARQARTEPRATDEELFAIADAVYEEAHGGEILNGLHEIARRVAAHVRAERCLVTRAVGMEADVSLDRHPRGLGERAYTLRVQCPTRPSAIAADVPASEVPARVARLLGEVSK